MDNNETIFEIVKARDENTQDYQYNYQAYLYSLMLSYVEHVKANLYNFKFVARLVDSDTTREVYLNLQMIVNDDSIVENSRFFYNKDENNRKFFMNPEEIEKKEGDFTSFRIDFSINNSESPNSYFFLMEAVNMSTNISYMININLETFFKISIFLYQLLNYNIIDGKLFLEKFNRFNKVPSELRNAQYTNLVESGTKIYAIFWDGAYILASIGESKDTITYMGFSEEEFAKLQQGEE